MIEFVTLVSRSRDVLDRAQLEPLTRVRAPGSLLKAGASKLLSHDGGRQVTLLRASSGRLPDGRSGAWVVGDGLAVGGDTGRAGESIVEAAIRRGADPGEILRDAARLRGNFVICASAADGTLVVVADPLGTYPIFTYGSPGLHGVSNNAMLLEAAIVAVGASVTRSPEAFAMASVFSSAAFDLTGYGQIRLAPIGTAFIVERGEVRREVVVSRRDRYRRDEDPEPLLDRAADEILENVREVSRLPHAAKVADLTGGADSRLVLAALMCEGLEDDYAYFCSGEHPGPDYSASAFIQDLYELREAINWFPPHRITVREDPVAFTRHLLYRTMGCYSSYFHTCMGNPYDSDLLRVHGGLAGTFKGVHSLGFGGMNARDAADHLLDSRRWRSRSEFLTSDFSERLESGVRSFIDERCEEGFAPDEALDQWYIENRNRYHFGVTWRVRLLQHDSFHALYSPSATSAAFRISAEDRAANRVGFELMARLYEPLRTLPFAEDRWADRLTASLPDRRLFDALRPFHPGSPVVQLIPGRWPTPRPARDPTAQDQTPPDEGVAAAQRDRAPRRRRRRSAWAEEQIRLGRPKWWRPFDAVLPAARDYVRSLPRDSPVWEWFRRECCEELLARGLEDGWRGREVLLVYKLLAASVWISGDESQNLAGEPLPPTP